MKHKIIHFLIIEFKKYNFKKQNKGLQDWAYIKKNKEYVKKVIGE